MTLANTGQSYVYGTIESWGVYYLDANVSKTFRLTESKQLSIRVDAKNFLNRPQH